MSVSLHNRRGFLGGLAAAAVFGPAVAVARPAVQAEGGLWQGIEFEDGGGRSFQLGMGGAPLTLIKLWAHWCPACLGEMTALSTMATALAGRVDVLLVSHPEYWAQDRAVAARRRLPFRLATPTASNGAGVVRAALTEDGAYSVPKSLVFRARDASVAWSRSGSMDWGSAGAVATVGGLG